MWGRQRGGDLDEGLDDEISETAYDNGMMFHSPLYDLTLIGGCSLASESGGRST